MLKINLTSINIIGAGAVGSHIAYILSRFADCPISIYDEDKVEIRNLKGQMFYQHQRFKGKASCVKENVFGLSGKLMTAFNVFVTEENKDFFIETLKPDGCIFLGADNMVVRQLVYSIVKDLPFNQYVVDVRMDSPYWQLHFYNNINKASLEEYEKTLFPDAEVVARCSDFQETFAASTAAGMAVNMLYHVVNVYSESPPYLFYNFDPLTFLM